jgi:hypothetical protein
MIPFIPIAHAQISLPGIHTNFPTVATAIVDFLAGGSFAINGAVFFIGALWMVGWAGKPEEASKGKDIMIDALKGMAITLGAYGILRTILYLLTA